MADRQSPLLSDKTGGHGYDRRHVVARCGVKGQLSYGGMRHVIWHYLTFRLLNGQAFAAEFVGMAPVDKFGMLRTDALNLGDIVVSPGLLYRKMIAMPARVMTVHLKAMKTWKPLAPLMAPEIDLEAAPVDVGAIYLAKPN